MPPPSDLGAGTDRDHLVVIGASAGGVETLLRVVSGLPADLAASVCIVLHLLPGAPSSLPAILQRRCRLPCRAAADGESLRAGEVLVAPPDHHLTVEDGRVSLTVGPRENGHRPSVDALFRSAALAGDGRVIGVVLSGTRDDGTAGLAVIKAEGGQAIVQDPKEALYPGMPASAIAGVAVDVVVPSEAVADAIVKAVAESPEVAALRTAPPAAGGNPGHRENPASGGDPGARRNPGPGHNPGPGGEPGSGGSPDLGDNPALGDNPGLGDDPSPAEPVTTTCPECGGVLSEQSEAGFTQWQCRVGHRYSPESLADAQGEGVEAALWAAIRALNDRQVLLERMAVHAQAKGMDRTARSFLRRAHQAGEQAHTVRAALGDAAALTLQMVADSEEIESERRRLG